MNTEVEAGPAERRQGPLAGRVAIVTGAGRGIGEAIAHRLAADGAAVVAAQRTAGEGEGVADAINAAGGDALAVPTDVGDSASVKALVAATLDRYGRLDVLCNNAGVGLIRSVAETSDEEYDYVMDANLRGVFVCMREAMGPLTEAGGSVVNIASVASFVGFPNDAAYCASKGGVLMLTRQAALDFAPHGVRVNAVCPGFIDTPMFDVYCEGQDDPVAARDEVLALHPIGRLGRPEDVAAAVAFLASDDAAWITGAALPVDGGLLTHC